MSLDPKGPRRDPAGPSLDLRSAAGVAASPGPDTTTSLYSPSRPESSGRKLDPAASLESEAGGGEAPLLTICIPTYNRAARVASLLTYMLPTIERFEGAVEILVSNNKSTDDTRDQLARFNSPVFRVHHRAVHVPTAEENIYGAVEFCRGRYVWFLGDDDIPGLHAIEAAIGALRQHPDFVYFNSQFIDSNSGLTGGTFARIHGSKVELDLEDGMCALGLTSNVPGISNVICLRQPLLEVDTKDILVHTRIYSHIAWWLKAFRGKRITVLNVPLVRYRVDEAETQFEHFKKVASRSEVGDYFFWSLGLIRLFKYMLINTGLTAQHLRSVWEFRRDGSTFRMLDNIVHMVFFQARASASATEDRNRLSTEDLNECIEFLLGMDLGFFETLRAIRRVHDAGGLTSEALKRTELAQAESDFLLLIAHKSATNTLADFLFSTDGYDFYRHVRGYVAFRSGASAARQEVLRYLDPQDIEEDVLYAETLEALRVRAPLCGRAYAARMRSVAPDRTAEQLARIAAVMERRLGEEEQIRTLQEALKERDETLTLAVRDFENQRLRAESLETDLRRRPVRPGVQEHFSTLLGKCGAFFDSEWYGQLLEASGEGSARVAADRRLEHFASVGSRSGLSPNPWFDEAWYVAHHADAREMVLSGQVVSGFDHYLQHGVSRRYDPGPRFSEQAYLAANADVAAAVNGRASELRSGLEHWLVYGQKEGRNLG